MKILPNWNLPDHTQAARRTRAAVERVDHYAIPAHAADIGKGKTYHLSTYGCQANERDSETMAGILETIGYEPAPEGTAPDLFLMNTCAIRENAADKVLGEIGSTKRLLKENPDMIVGICGCMSQEDTFVRKVLEHYPWVKLLFGTHNLQDLPALLLELEEKGERVVQIFSRQGEVYENLPVKRFGRHKAWVNIMYGCDKFCTYCIVPYTRGKQRSRFLQDILAEVEELKQAGFKEVTLLGQNVNAYGKDLEGEEDFACLLEAVAKTGIQRVRFMTSHPWDFSDRMIEVMAQYPNIMPYVHLPLQSGDDQVLARMGRRYTSQEYLALYDKIREKLPHAAVSTDIIVGFPDESEEAFQHTLDMVRRCRYDNAFTFLYSPRPGTPAAKMKDGVPLEVKKRRLQELNDLWHGFAREKNEQLVGSVVPVLVDGPSRKDKQVWSGYSDTNKPVNFTGENVKAGDIVNVRITSAKTFSLDGEMV